MVVAASVEFPDVTAAYASALPSGDGTIANGADGYNFLAYVRTAAYVGYFDSTMCYAYNGTPDTDPYPSGFSNSDVFVPSLAADLNHECDGNTFSGNFMNWATMSAVDEFRYAMTGGNRILELPVNGAVIERSYLPDGNVPGVEPFYKSLYFPGLNLSDSGTTPFSSTLGRVLPRSLVTGGNVYITNCRNVVYFDTASNVQSTNCLPVSGSGQSQQRPASGRSTYHVAVTVCDSTEGPIRTDLCKLYGSGVGAKYKPVGQAQVHAADMRFASFGYLMDRNVAGYTVPSNCPQAPNGGSRGWNPCRYGGVLRSPMKYLGQQSFDANQNALRNGNAEINPDGSLVPDPEGTAATAGGVNSGFINYLNKFGQTGVYKRYDPMGELYYEALRYLSGLPPTPDAMTGAPLPFAVLDNFPLAYTNASGTAWADPMQNQSTCSANYIITIADNQTNYDTNLPGYAGVWADPFRPSSRPVDEHGLDTHLWTQRIGILESTTSPSLTSGDYDRALAGLEDTQPICCLSNLVAGAAFWANTNDIRPDLPGMQTVKSIGIDVFPQEKNSSGNPMPLNNRQLYLMAKYGGFNNVIDRSSDPYPNPFYSTDPTNPLGPAIRTNAEWADSTGAPTNYLLASNPQKLIDGLRSAFNRIQASSGTLGGAALTASSLAYGGSSAYVATFDANFWSGTVLDKTITQTNGVVSTSSAAVWDAGALLTARCGTTVPSPTTCRDTNSSVNNRKIVTTIRPPSGNGTRVATAFTWAGLQSDTQYTDVLNMNPSLGSADGAGQQRLDYLRGYRGDESSSLGFRARNSALGDIIDSGPTYVGAPTTAIADSDYQTFYTTNVNRTPAVYVGANDGMLHAFSAGTGAELFAYIPNFVNYALNDLTDANYTHETFVDAPVIAREVKANGTWKTVLVAGVGNGAQGVFALDVTSPTAFTTSSVLFEFSDADDADVGNVLSAPEIVKLQTGGTAAAPTYGYFAAVTGYNNRRTTTNGRTDTNVSGDSANRGVLFLLSLDHTLGTSWQLGTDYFKYHFPATNPAAPNGLGPVASFQNRNGSGAASSLYFGDLQGNVWRFNTVGLPSEWAPSRGTVALPLPFFVATTTVGAAQPITARPTVATGPYNSELIFVGTGQYVGNSDLSTPFAQQSEYALLDNNQGALITRSTDLVVRTGTVAGNSVTVGGSAFVYSGASSQKGWVLDFPSSLSGGERNITQASVSNGVLSFTSLTVASSICGAGGGYIYQLNALTGLPYPTLPGGTLSTVGIPGPPKVVDLFITQGQTRATGERINTRTTTTLVAGTSGNIGAPPLNITSKAPPVGRITWREITNYNDRR
ncbi:MAG: PilC/PilY family type IV pilus protein [Burkholderiaceae bacterium]